ncbi:MAG: flagellar basal body P-ring formation chaperone FlgA [Rhodanobacter sp.]
MRRSLLTMFLLIMSPPLLASPALQRVASARIVEAARAELDARLGDSRAMAQVSLVGTPEDVLVLPGTLTLHVRQPTGRWPRSRVSVPVDISVNGEVVRSATVWFALSVHHDVLSYAADAQLGAVASALKFVPHDADVAGLQGNVIADPHDLDGMRLRHSVVAGSPAVREDFEHIPDVDRRDRVQVMVAYGSIQMQAKGTAIGQGNTGDTVSVLVDGAEAPVRVRITDKGVVKVVD